LGLLEVHEKQIQLWGIYRGRNHLTSANMLVNHQMIQPPLGSR
jgi:hypothetical protein